MSQVETVEMIEDALVGAKMFRKMSAEHLSNVERNVPFINLHTSLPGLMVNAVLKHARKQNLAAVQFVSDLELLLLVAKKDAAA